MKKKSNSNRDKERTAAKAVKENFKGKVMNALPDKADEQALVTCKILEYQELTGLEAEIAGKLSTAYCYEYESKETLPDGSKAIIRGIRAVGAREAIRFTKARLFKFIPQFKYEKEDLGEGWYREVVYCTNPKTGEVTRSSCQWQRGSRFGDRTAATNAERNAMLKQLPAEMKLLFINYCVEKGYMLKMNVDPKLPENVKAVQELPDRNTQAEAGKEVTAALVRIYAIIGALKADKEKTRLWLHKSYKVASLKELTLETLKKISTGLADISNNEVGKCAKPKAGVMTPEEFRTMIAALKINEKGELCK